MNKLKYLILISCITITTLCNLSADEALKNKLGLNATQTSQFISDTRDYIAAERTCFEISSRLYWGNGRSLYPDLLRNSSALYDKFEAETGKLNKFLSGINKITDLQTIRNSLLNAYNEGIKIADERTSGLWLTEEYDETKYKEMKKESEQLLEEAKATLNNFKKNYDHIIDQFQK